MKRNRKTAEHTRPLRKGESWALSTGQAPPLGGRPGPGHTVERKRAKR